MKIGCITIFPDMLRTAFRAGVTSRALKKGIVDLEIHDLRNFADRVDDRPYGGGKGMVMKYAPIRDAILHVKSYIPNAHIVLPTPSGIPATQALLKYWIGKDLLFICGRYEGIDQRIIDKYVDTEVCVGDFVVSGGELPTLMLLDGIFRLLPGVLGNTSATLLESFENGMLGHPVYTKPRSIDDLEVPDVLLSGDHGKIQEWKNKKRMIKTQEINRKKDAS